MADLTAYLNDTKTKLGNIAIVNRAYPNYYNLDGSNVLEYHAPEGGHFSGGLFYTSRLVATHAQNALPDSLASTLKMILERKLYEYNLNKGVVTPKP